MPRLPAFIASTGFAREDREKNFAGASPSFTGSKWLSRQRRQAHVQSTLSQVQPVVFGADEPQQDSCGMHRQSEPKLRPGSEYQAFGEH